MSFTKIPNMTLLQLLPTIISLTLPLTLRLKGSTLEPNWFFIFAGVYLIVAEGGYRYSLERWVSEFGQYTGLCSHIGVCLLAQVYIVNTPDWRGEIIYWAVFLRWAVGMSRTHNKRVLVFRRAHSLLRQLSPMHRCDKVVAATIFTYYLLPKTNDLWGWLETAGLWVNFFYSWEYAFAVTACFFRPGWRPELVARARRELEEEEE
ncbi:hypothetical protein DM02DRAFT_137081 [Periconia macrospinosa]|uniref:Uncharacterized protein n=1 Tax=Periconia macrospinosa TaxID=97972 RepID=A0A2V1DCZ9_9PLEO|nr:hypothetical protein DM02DRAFT_137081 [Periconia macrospinosa]